LTSIPSNPNLHLELSVALEREVDGISMSALPEQSPGSPGSGRILGYLTAFWLGVWVLGGTADYLAKLTDIQEASWVQSLTFPLLMSILWIPVSFVILKASVSYPPASFHPRLKIHPARAALHGLASLGAGFLLNAVFFSILALSEVIPPQESLSLTAETGFRFLHINAGVYWAVVGVAHLPGVLASRASALRRAAAQDAFEETLTVRSGNQSIVVRVSDIRWIEGAGDYVRLHLGVANHLHSERLKRLENRLDPGRFVRVHRSAIVNVEAVRKLKHLGHGDYEALLEDGSSVRVSRRRRSQLKELLEKREVGEGPE
jgi:hypothetical protein